MSKILLVDDQEELLEVMALALEGRPQTEVVKARSGNEAIRILSSRHDIDCIVCDYRMPDGSGGDVFKYLTSVKSRIPFILCSSETPVDYPEFVLKSPTGHLRKPFGMGGLERIMREVLGPRNEEGYFRVSTKSVRALGGVHGDLYLKLSDGKFLKIYQSDDAFTEEDYRKLEAKSVTDLYLKNEGFQIFMDSLMRDFFAIWKLKGSNPATALELSAALHRLGQDLVQQFGLDQATRTLIQEAVEFSIATISEQPKLLEWIGRLPMDVQRENFISSHSVLVAYLSNAICAAMGWATKANFNRLGLAAFLHDITLENPELARCQTLDEARWNNIKFSDVELTFFESHPHLSAELVRGVAGLPPDLDQIILQHHEQPDGSGFPGGHPAAEIHPMACVFILAEDLATRILDSNSKSISGHLEKMRPRFPDGLFRKLLDASMATLAPGGSLTSNF